MSHKVREANGERNTVQSKLDSLEHRYVAGRCMTGMIEGAAHVNSSSTRHHLAPQVSWLSCSEGLLWKIHSDTMGRASDDSLGKHRVAGVIRPKTAREAYTARRSEWYQL